MRNNFEMKMKISSGRPTCSPDTTSGNLFSTNCALNCKKEKKKEKKEVHTYPKGSENKLVYSLSAKSESNVKYVKPFKPWKRGSTRSRVTSAIADQCHSSAWDAVSDKRVYWWSV